MTITTSVKIDSINISINYEKNNETIEKLQEQKTPRLIPKTSEEEPELDKLV